MLRRVAVAQPTRVVIVTKRKTDLRRFIGCTSLIQRRSGLHNAHLHPARALLQKTLSRAKLCGVERRFEHPMAIHYLPAIQKVIEFLYAPATATCQCSDRATDQTFLTSGEVYQPCENPL